MHDPISILDRTQNNLTWIERWTRNMLRLLRTLWFVGGGVEAGEPEHLERRWDGPGPRRRRPWRWTPSCTRSRRSGARAILLATDRRSAAPAMPPHHRTIQGTSRAIGDKIVAGFRSNKDLSFLAIGDEPEGHGLMAAHVVTCWA